MIRPAARRLPAAVLATLWMATLLGGMVHGLVEKHVYCPDHSVFEETSPGGERHDDSVVGFTAGGEVRQHQACAFACLGAKPAVPQPDTVAARVDVAPDAPAVVVARAFPARPVPILRTAPKGSPPPPLA